MTKSDRQYIDQKFEMMNEKYDRLLTMLSNLTGSVASIEENTSVLSYHNGEHFDKDEEQDKRLDRIESHLSLPKFAL